MNYFLRFQLHCLQSSFFMIVLLSPFRFPCPILTQIIFFFFFFFSHTFSTQHVYNPIKRYPRESSWSWNPIPKEISHHTTPHHIRTLRSRHTRDLYMWLWRSLQQQTHQLWISNLSQQWQHQYLPSATHHPRPLEKFQLNRLRWEKMKKKKERKSIRKWGNEDEIYNATISSYFSWQSMERFVMKAEIRSASEYCREK